MQIVFLRILYAICIGETRDIWIVLFCSILFMIYVWAAHNDDCGATTDSAEANHLTSHIVAILTCNKLYNKYIYTYDILDVVKQIYIYYM